MCTKWSTAISTIMPPTLIFTKNTVAMFIGAKQHKLYKSEPPTPHIRCNGLSPAFWLQECLKQHSPPIYFFAVATISIYALWGQNFSSNQLVKTPAKLCQSGAKFIRKWCVIFYWCLNFIGETFIKKWCNFLLVPEFNRIYKTKWCFICYWCLIFIGAKFIRKWCNFLFVPESMY